MIDLDRIKTGKAQGIIKRIGYIRGTHGFA
jgi:hypothetical protein